MGSDAWYLLGYVTGVSRSQYFLDPEREVPQEQEVLYRQMIDKRSTHIPLQHLTGEQEFMGLTFKVNEHVLIPRQDTEVLVEEALNYVRSGMDILDVYRIGMHLIERSEAGEKSAVESFTEPVDLSREALQVAEENAGRLPGRSHISAQRSLFAEVQGQYDMILSNPPYIEKQWVETLEEEVRYP